MCIPSDVSVTDENAQDGNVGGVICGEGVQAFRHGASIMRMST